MLIKKRCFRNIVMLGFLIFISCALEAAPVSNIGQMAQLITQSFVSITKLITATAYVGGIGFSLGAIMKFRQHKDNPTQIPVGTPVAMLLVASALLFFPTVLNITGNSIFGTTKTAGPSGLVPLD
jgi:intracellular multiplication protein IcmD